MVVNALSFAADLIGENKVSSLAPAPSVASCGFWYMGENTPSLNALLTFGCCIKTLYFPYFTEHTALMLKHNYDFTRFNKS